MEGNLGSANSYTSNRSLTLHFCFPIDLEHVSSSLEEETIQPVRPHGIFHHMSRVVFPFDFCTHAVTTQARRIILQYSYIYGIHRLLSVVAVEATRTNL